ncbi:MAG TPA: M1 family aminopeptidase [Pyrinomonadaceae bacterium]|nr:M1 family aminopeptidase [Pyrinomonadaceae bacterium]
MKNLYPRTLLRLVACIAVLVLASVSAAAQETATSKDKDLYNQLKAFSLTGGVMQLKGVVLKRGRAQITLDGTVYLSQPVGGMITGAVFIGEGKFIAQPPNNEFEKANVKRLLGSEVVESDFKTAVFRFTDDTALQFGELSVNGPANERAQKLAREADERTLRETGANLAARLAISILNAEKPGFFFATFDGGRRGKFSMLIDHQNRIPVANFRINAGEKGLLWSYDSDMYFTEVWMAFYSEEDYARNSVEYSDANDQIDIAYYRMEADLRDPKSRLRLNAHIEAVPLQPNVRAIAFSVGEGLGEFEEQRLKKQMRVTSVRRDDVELAAVQENWEGGFTVFLPAALKANEELELDISLEGDIVRDIAGIDCYYPRSTTSWYPRHGYLDRATYDLTFRHSKKLHVASIGARLSEELDEEDKDALISKYRMPLPVSLVTFALGPFKRHNEEIKWEKGNAPTPLEFNSLPGEYMPIKEDFILAELNNSVRYFTALFGNYPYPAFGAAYHPFGFGQGFPSLLMIPSADTASKFTYQFIAHETAHQWWGNIVAWRSYRDQWLSEGFAEYSGILYTGLRSNQDAKNDLLGRLRSSLKDPPITPTGPGKGRLVDVGPIILGHRLNTIKTGGAYQVLIYNKGALVLRMLHFMLSNPATGEGQPFFDMMTDFVERYRNKTASSDDFREVASEHFARSPIGKKYGMANLNWLFYQAVYETELPSYELQYKMEDQPDGKVLISGTISQQNAPPNWLMVLPVQFSFSGKQKAMGTVLVQGASSPFQIRLPMRPNKVELDPDRWILAEKVSTKGN